MNRQLLQQALDALVEADVLRNDKQDVVARRKTIDALYAALTQQADATLTNEDTNPQPVQPASVNMPITPSEKMCEAINGGYGNLSTFDKERLIGKAQLLYASLLKLAQPASQKLAYICQGCGGLYWTEVSCDCNTKAAFDLVAVSNIAQPVQPAINLHKVHPEWESGPSLFKDWCSQWFGTDSDESYLAQAVLSLPTHAAQPVQPASVTDAETIPKGVLAAIRNAGLMLTVNQYGYQLHNLGRAVAYAAPTEGSQS